MTMTGPLNLPLHVPPTGSPSARASLVQTYLARSGMFTPGVGDPHRYDEMTGSQGSLLPGWTELAAEIDAIGEVGLSGLAGQVDRLLEDDGVTYTPVDAVGSHPDATPAGPQRWHLDPLPLVVGEAEWARLEAGLIQRSTLLDAVLTDLYGPGKLVENGLLPPELVYQHPDYLRPAHGIVIPGAHQLFFHALDVCRDVTGEFQALGDRTQAPSGAGYAMADRRAVSKVLPDLFRRTAPRGLSAFFHTMRSALASVAPGEAQDPRVVVLTPGTHSETAFDQAMLASLLGVPLVESADLTIRRGRLWMLSMGRFEPVDVVVRRVDAAWSDPLDLRPDSRLGVVGLAEACRRGTVTVVNTLGSGVLENPGFIPFLPKLGRAVLGESLKVRSVPTFWCGDDAGRGHVLANLDRMVLRSTTRAGSVFPAMMSRDELGTWRARIEAEPTRWVGQELAPFSEAPMATPDGLTAGQVSLRLFTVAHGSGYVAMPGSLGRVQDGELTSAGRGRTSVAKDVWVRSGRAEAPDRRDGRVWLYEGPLVAPEPVESTASPRVLEDMFWLGRYAERTEDLVRLLTAARYRVDDFRFRPEHLGAGCVPVLLAAVSSVSGTRAISPDEEPTRRLRELMLDTAEKGSVAQSLAGLRESARSVRDQLSGDTWMVLAATDRAVGELADAAPGAGMVLASKQADVLSGMLALSGLISENMIRDPGWYFLDLGRRIERAQQVIALVRATLTRSHSSATDSLVVESVLAASESGVTYRRRYRGRIQVATMLELLLLDAGNPRSLAYQVAAARTDLRALPDSSGTSRPVRRLEEVDSTLRRVRPEELDRIGPDGVRTELLELLDGLYDALRGIADAIATQHFWHPSPMHSLGVVTLQGVSR
jgi:uncharacterized circularly permuted ATP-grasp superfamily protein/uncharacterized alpha-E superfamily protein